MTLRAKVMKALMQEDLNFLVTNRLPRRAATKAIGRLSKVEHPAVAKPSLAIWRFFSGADLSDSAEIRFRSLHHGFTRSLKPGARAFDPDPDVVASPCDAIVGAHGIVTGGELHQVKGYPYRMDELVPDAALAAAYEGGSYVTLRLTAGMYHRFHAPHDLTVEAVTYLSGDCWNVNPIALKRVERLFCRNERAVIETRLPNGVPMLLVPVAAILVASIRLTFLDTERTLREHGPGRVPVNARLSKGDEMGWFEHGSTIIAFLPPGVMLSDELGEGEPIRAGEALARL
jgi:phosphatidylserine decarboxylase